MTDQHPLTDWTLFEKFGVYYGDLCTFNADDMRAAADWQLEQVIEWLKEHAAEYSYEDYYGACYNENGLLDDFKEAMRPTNTQEDN